VLAEPTRRSVFEAVRVARSPVSRDQVAAELGLQRTLAAFHLDRLAEAGLLEVSYARPPGRTGRGAGRPLKRYDARNAVVCLNVPRRHPELVGRLLARAVSEQPRHADRRATELANEEGRRLGHVHNTGKRLNPQATLQAAAEALRDLGYEPQEQSDESVRLRNCPFHGVVEAAPELVCAMNQRMVEGLLDGLGGSRQVHAELRPTVGECCVLVAKRRRALRP
jgi:predicted ArsR family transcriptional regulator